MSQPSVLFSSQSPVQGARPDADPGGLPMTILHSSENLRSDGFVLRVRRGALNVRGGATVAADVASLVPGATIAAIRGSSRAMVNISNADVELWVVAAELSTGETELFRVLPGSGAWNRRFTTAGNAFLPGVPVSIAIVRDIRGVTGPGGWMIVASDGTTTRTFDLGGSSLGSLWGASTVQAQSAMVAPAESVVVEEHPFAWGPVSDAAITVAATGNLTLTKPGTGVLVLTFTVPDATGSTATMTWSAGALTTNWGASATQDYDLSSGPTVTFWYTDVAETVTSPFDICAIQTQNSAGTWVDWFDPNLGHRAVVEEVQRPNVVPSPSGADLDRYMKASIAGLPGSSTVRGFRFIVRARNWSPFLGYVLRGVTVGGRVPYAAAEVSLLHAPSRSESSSVVREVRPGPTVSPFLLAANPATWYQFPGQYRISRGLPTSVRVRGNPGTYDVALYVGGTFYARGVASGANPLCSAGNEATVQPTWLAPGAPCLPMPMPRCFGTSSGRLLVGAGQQVWSSDYQYPFRFRPTPGFGDDPDRPLAWSGSVAVVDGQTVRAIASAQGDLKLAPVHVFSDRSLYRMDTSSPWALSRLTQLAPYGISSPGTISEWAGSTWWVDERGFVRTVGTDGAVSPALNRRRITFEDLSSGLGCMSGDEYTVLFRRPADGVGNRRAAVYDTQSGEWWGDSYVAAGIQIASVIDGRSRSVILSDGGVARLEGSAAGDIVGGNVAWSLTTASVRDDAWGALSVRGVGIVATPQSGGSVAVTLLNRMTGATVAGTIDVATSDVSAFRWARLPDGATMPGVRSPEVQITLSGSAPPAWALRTLAVRADRERAENAR